MGIYLGSNQIDNINLISYQSFNTDIEDSLVNRTIISYSNSEISNIRDFAFYYCSSLTLIDLPQATSIGSTAFYYCSSLTSVSLPQITTIGNYAFAYCTFLTSIDLPQVTSIGSNAFAYCSSLTSVSLPQATTIGNSAFAYCSSLASVSLPKVISIGSSAFRNCYRLMSLYLTEVSSVPVLGTNVFNSTPIGGYFDWDGQYGSVYVLASLYSSYIAASNWSVYSARIVGVDTMTIDYYNGEYSEDYLYEPSMTWADWVNSNYNTVGFTVNNNNYICMQDSVTGDFQRLEDNMGEELFATEVIADCTDTPFYMPVYLSKSGFNIEDINLNSSEFIYDINMTWAEWINSDYNTTNLTIDTNNSYVGLWDDTNNTYIYLTETDNTSNIVISTHKIREDIANKPNNIFTINTSLSI